ncbi:TRAP transporter large permease subunit [Chelatococcus daeguensis]|uniref:C4-dicarboxylate ABC transporter n=2 Tax=Chelatococcus TaxID=28209 RepID=A0AAC9NYK7_9HYPH|nr:MULTISPECIES: TRAP transporter large permease subunit [Chelatococcus]APF37100.1 C4-dicarboxylate ABC transporter [Chelatococcus daeguensis]KZE35614.1 C4-dicarboxylate ABC transporter [Chelatococcus daeguensis]MBM3084891.1 TRAP transporter large permease subunit [Chelatococcus daeguensis]CUA87848.1 TRAP-type mannitol/chloroaromatic compound transport system, large permease component [Chelatococcus sambhunathii]
MVEFFIHNMAPIMFAALVIFLLLGYPVAFALAANGLIFGLIGIELGLFVPDFLQALPERVYGTMNNDVLLAIPFFTFMGLILERSGMAEDLLDTIGQLFGTVRGGVAYAVVFVGALLAATTGVVAASVISMGLISLPIMLRYGYDRRLATGIIAASGTLAQIIPPSLVLIVMADQLGRSVGDMYQGAFIPGVVLTLLYAGYVFVASMASPKMAPGLPPEAQTLNDPDGRARRLSLLVVTVIAGTAAYLVMQRSNVRNLADLVVLTMTLAVAIAFVLALLNKLLRLKLLSRMAEEVIFVMVPPLALVFLVLGTIFIGVATPTEGGAMGATGAVLLALFKRRLTFDLLRQATFSTAKLSAFVLFILLGARVFALTFYGVDGHKWVEELLVALPGGEIGFLLFVNFLVFVLGCFLDFFEIAFIIIPLLVPAVERLGIDLIWFGVILAINLQTSFLTPPFGFALFYLRSVAPRQAYRDRLTGKTTAPILTSQIYWGALPFILIQILMVAIVMLFPQMVLHYKSGHVELDEQQLEQQLQNLAPGLDQFAPPMDLGPPKFD